MPLPRSVPWISAALVALCAGAGCARMDYTAHLLDQRRIEASALPRIKIDKQASLMAMAAFQTDPQLLNKSEILDAIEAYWNQSATGDPQPARVAIGGTLEPGACSVVCIILGFELTAGVAFLLGMPTGDAESHLQVTVDIKGQPRPYTGVGEGYCLSWIYHPRDYDQCAVSEAVGAALRNAASD